MYSDSTLNYFCPLLLLIPMPRAGIVIGTRYALNQLRPLLQVTVIHPVLSELAGDIGLCGSMAVAPAVSLSPGTCNDAGESR